MDKDTKNVLRAEVSSVISWDTYRCYDPITRVEAKYLVVSQPNCLQATDGTTQPKESMNYLIHIPYDLLVSVVESQESFVPVEYNNTSGSKERKTMSKISKKSAMMSGYFR